MDIFHNKNKRIRILLGSRDIRVSKVTHDSATYLRVREHIVHPHTVSTRLDRPQSMLTEPGCPLGPLLDLCLHRNVTHQLLAVTGRLENKLVHHHRLSVITSLTIDKFLTNVKNVSHVISCCVFIYIVGVYAR